MVDRGVTAYLVRRLAASLLLLLLVLTLTFFVLRLAPGDPAARIDPRIPADHQQRLHAIYGLDRPLGEQYVDWLGGVLTGDWGMSFTHRRPVTTVLAERLPATLLLTVTSLALQFSLGVWLGVAAARRPGSPRDLAIRLAAVVLYSLPLFWLSILAVEVVADAVPFLPSGHMRSVGADSLGPLARLLDLLRHLLLPAATLAVATAGGILRFTRNSLLDTLSEDYVRTARAKGLDEARVVWLHALKNAGAPLVQLFGLSFPFLLSGSLIVEVVFSWPGMGRLTYEAVKAYDYPLVLAGTALAGTLVVAGNLVADLLHAAIDPRVRKSLHAS
jgi:peptide/nickel transport system permease protein